ncbi:hypothetical protein KIM67_16900, partial [Flagellimonas sp. 389]|uniref:hypothetical protein n=1 Tax=Flagellimonas sp. 389 TaxID=2835862 RepID=UPI001BD48584
LTQYGNVTMALKGTRPDGVPFEDSANFKFTPVTLQNEDGSYSTLTITEIGNGLRYGFELTRFLSAPDDVYQDAHLYFFIQIDNLGEPEEEFGFIEFVINNYAVIGDDNKYFIMNDVFNFAEVPESEFSNFVFDPETYNLTFSYNFMVDEENNSSSNPIEISGEANVFVKELVEE